MHGAFVGGFPLQKGGACTVAADANDAVDKAKTKPRAINDVNSFFFICFHTFRIIQSIITYFGGSTKEIFLIISTVNNKYDKRRSDHEREKFKRLMESFSFAVYANALAEMGKINTRNFMA